MKQYIILLVASWLMNAHASEPILVNEPEVAMSTTFTGGVSANGMIVACSPKGHVRNLANLYGRSFDDKLTCDHNGGYWVSPSFLIPPGSRLIGYRVLGKDNYVGRGGTHFSIYYK